MENNESDVAAIGKNDSVVIVNGELRKSNAIKVERCPWGCWDLEVRSVEKSIGKNILDAAALGEDDRPRYRVRTWSLIEIMNKFQPEDLAVLSSFMQALITMDSVSNELLTVVTGRPRIAAIADVGPSRLIIQHLRPICSSLGLTASAATVKKIERLCGEAEPHSDALMDLMRELQGRLRDELEAITFFSLTDRDANYYDKPRDGWLNIIARFPDIVLDVEEASKCLAFARYPAAVFHSVQIVERGLIEVGKFIGVADPLSGWTAVAKRLKQIVETKHDDRAAFEQANYPFIEQLQGTVEALKNAWRNKISHAHGKLTVMTADFSAEVAEDILYASRTFMRRLADGLPRPTPSSAFPPLPGPPSEEP